MNQDAHGLLNNYCMQVLGQPLELCHPTGLSGYDALECLWPVNDIFRPYLHQIKTVGYHQKNEAAADDAIINFALNDVDWSVLPIHVLRVLLERHQQAILLCIANAMADNKTVMYMPAELPQEARAKFAVAFLWYQMTLPYEVTEGALLDIDSPFENLIGRPH